MRLIHVAAAGLAAALVLPGTPLSAGHPIGVPKGEDFNDRVHDAQLCARADDAGPTLACASVQATGNSRHAETAAATLVARCVETQRRVAGAQRSARVDAVIAFACGSR